MSLDKLALRTIVGGLMVGHGLQKLNGSFGGPGLEGVEQMMGSIGLHPAKQQARAAALSETIGGGLTAAGFLSPLGPAMIMGTMAVAINKVHLKNGVWVSKGGFEYNLTLIAASFALAAEGPGLLSIDGVLRKQRHGLKWGLLAAGLGFGVAAAVMKASDKFAPQADATDYTPNGAPASHQDHHAQPGHAEHADEAGHDHSGHDHSGHDHSGHDHSGHEHEHHEAASSENGH